MYMVLSIFLIVNNLLNILCLQNNISDEFYECINPSNEIFSPSECTSIIIPDSDKFKCCSMKIVFNGNISYNCFALESEYTNNKSIFDEYIANKSIASLFLNTGGEIEIDCGDNMKSSQKVEKLSDEFLGCYKSHVSGVNNENDCHKYDIPNKEMGKCCFVEIQQINKEGNKTTDKRCYVIQDEYFSKEKNFNNYLLDKSNIESLDELKNISITINCKNYDVFHFKSKSFETFTDDQDPIIIDGRKKDKDSGISAGAIVGIIIAVIVVLIGVTFIVIYCIKKRKPNIEHADSANKIDINKTINNN